MTTQQGEPVARLRAAGFRLSEARLRHEIERRAAYQLARECDGRVPRSRIAELLGVSRPALYRALREPTPGV